jgi:LacI family transcriptional regulator
VAGFDDDPLAELLTPPLTTVRQPFMEMGRAALEMLCARIEHPALPSENRVLSAVREIRRCTETPHDRET